VFAVSRDGVEVGRMASSKRLYEQPRQATTETAIRTTGFADLYVALGDGDGKGGWACAFITTCWCRGSGSARS